MERPADDLFGVVTHRRRPTARESEIVSAIVGVLSKVPESQVFKTHGSAFSASGVPDLFFTCSMIGGRAVWVEVKRPGQSPTRVQAARMSALSRSGALCYVWRSADDARRFVRSIGA